MTYTWKNLIECDNHSTAHILKSVLESNEITVNINDENMAMYKGGLVPLRLQVFDYDFERAYNILVENGYLKVENDEIPELLSKIISYTEAIPFLNNLRSELRILIIIGCILFIIIFTSVLISYNV